MPAEPPAPQPAQPDHLASNPYFALSRSFNAGRVRAIISSGQAVVWHRMSEASKDGDWIVREDADDLAHIRAVLAERGAVYRFGAPLDVRWLAGGWSAHLEFQDGPLRLRTDFVSRPPRLSPARLAALWRKTEHDDPPVIGILDLIALKLTQRERDYPIVGTLAKRLSDPAAILRHSRSATMLLRTAAGHGDLLAPLASERPLLATIPCAQETLEAALDHERRELMRRDQRRIAAYVAAMAGLARARGALEAAWAGKPLADQHRILVECCAQQLPVVVHVD